MHSSPPRIFPKQKERLQFNETDCTGDWCLFEDHTEIRVYGAEVPPYHLPVFPSMRIFAHGFIRQVLSADQAHFVPSKKGYIFRLPNTVGPFTIDSRHTLSSVERMLREINFPRGDAWHYDPTGFITRRKKKIKSTTYDHELRALIEWKANYDSWPLDTEMEAESLAAERK